MRPVLGVCFRGAKTNTVLHSQAPALHPFACVQASWTNRAPGQTTDGGHPITMRRDCTTRMGPAV